MSFHAAALCGLATVTQHAAGKRCPSASSAQLLMRDLCARLEAIQEVKSIVSACTSMQRARKMCTVRSCPRTAAFRH